MATFLKRLAEWQQQRRQWAAERREKERREVEKFNRQYDELGKELENEINPLPLDEARQRAERLLSDPATFKCWPARPCPKEDARLDTLAPMLRAFFERFETALHLESGVMLARHDLDDLPIGQGFVTIGSTGMEHVVLAVKPGEETVYEIATDVPEEEYEGDLSEGDFTSVYHCILYYHRQEMLLFSERE